MKGGIIVDWNAIKAEYIAGGTTYEKLAEKYGVSLSKIKRIGSDEKWRDLANQTRTKTNRKLTSSISGSQVKRAVRVKRSACNSLDNILKKIEEKSAADDISPAELYQCVKTVKEILIIEGLKPRADRQEQEARIASLNRQAEKDNKTDTTINIIMGDGNEDYSV